MDCSPPGSPVPGILQARTLEWVAISFSNAWKWKVKVKSLSRVRLPVTPWAAAYQAPPPMGFSRQEYWSGVPLPSLQRHTTKHNISFLLHLVLQNLNNMRNIYHLFPIRKNCLPEFILFHFILFSIRKWKKKKTIKPCFQVTGKWALSFGPVTVPEMSSDQESNDMRNSRKLVLG